jgi:RNA polymerase sigma-54 factor
LIRKKIKCSLKEIQETIKKDITSLNLHPGIYFSSQLVQTIIPDVTLRQEGESLIVDVDRDYAPTLKINRRYLKLLNDSNTPKTKQFIKRHLSSARWLMTNLQLRYSILEKIVQYLAGKQRDFFINPEGKLKPLTMKMVGKALKFHKSTIARVVANK